MNYIKLSVACFLILLCLLGTLWVFGFDQQEVYSFAKSKMLFLWNLSGFAIFAFIPMLFALGWAFWKYFTLPPFERKEDKLGLGWTLETIEISAPVFGFAQTVLSLFLLLPEMNADLPQEEIIGNFVRQAGKALGSTLVGLLLMLGALLLKRSINYGRRERDETRDFCGPVHLLVSDLYGADDTDMEERAAEKGEERTPKRADVPN